NLTLMRNDYNIRYIIMISFISAIGGYLFGFDFAVISGALPFLKVQFGLTAYWEGFTTGSLALGCMLGCLLAGGLSEKYGRKVALMIAASIFAVSSLAMALAPSLSLFIAARFVAGIGVGMASMLSPMYIAEVSPAALRGRMVALNQLTVVIGILVTNLVNYTLRNNGDEAWRWMFGFGLIPSALFCVGILFLPESPRWLIKKGKHDRAKKVLSRIGKPHIVNATLSQMEQAVSKETKMDFSLPFRKPFAAALVAGVVLAVFQQFCGINVVFNYSTTIFESMGFNKSDQLMQTVFIGAVNLFFTFVALLLVDKLGRKPLMLLGAAGLAVLYILIAQFLEINALLSTVLLLAAIGLYACTLAPVTWVLISEIFPVKVRSEATTIAVVCLWAAYFILTFTFPILAELMGGIAQTFYIYAAICFIAAFFIWKKVRETKGIALEDMDSLFSH
ncbi:MAG TPA: sugar porter family MFS transporter, partial [Chitinophagaceae bacterium]|nr:sugar porter family MFS transporter [Chitinophagaceae bacterium]